MRGRVRCRRKLLEFLKFRLLCGFFRSLIIDHIYLSFWNSVYWMCLNSQILNDVLILEGWVKFKWWALNIKINWHSNVIQILISLISWSPLRGGERMVRGIKNILQRWTCGGLNHMKQFIYNVHSFYAYLCIFI